MDESLSVEQVVERYGLPSAGALYAMRCRGTGPRGYRIGRVLRFKMADLLAWEASRADQPKATR